MRSKEDWFSLYAKSHTHPLNILIHKIFVPLIMLSLLGLLWSVPSPVDGCRILNWSFLLSVLSLVFYYRLGFKIFVLMSIQFSLMLTFIYYFEKTGVLLLSSLVIFIFSWIAQFIGHKIEGKKPSFFEDLQFLLIGPVWVFLRNPI
jgi:uncharacterized membrane protein YGL010W